MNRYIDADKFIAEIKKRIDFYHERGYGCDNAIEAELDNLLTFIGSPQQEQSEVNLEKFTQKMNDWKARYNYSDNISIKATMAFTARMFYQYPNVARQWYDNLPKTTMD